MLQSPPLVVSTRDMYSQDQSHPECLASAQNVVSTNPSAARGAAVEDLSYNARPKTDGRTDAAGGRPGQETFSQLLCLATRSGDSLQCL